MRQLCFIFLALIVSGLAIEFIAGVSESADVASEAARAMSLPWRYLILLALPVVGIAWRRQRRD